VTRADFTGDKDRDRKGGRSSTRPSSAWQRGTNENTNGLVRQFFPKGTDLANISEHQFTKVQQLLNDRPRKRLGYRSPNEILAPRLRVAIET
jgi:IS30 family transposase